MKFGPVPVGDAVGAILAHSVKHAGGMFKKGRVLTADDIALLKAQIGRLGRSVGESAVQVHGGIGMTDELAVGHYLKRILAVEAMLGSTDYHLRRLGAG